MPHPLSMAPALCLEKYTEKKKKCPIASSSQQTKNTTQQRPLVCPGPRAQHPATSPMEAQTSLAWGLPGAWGGDSTAPATQAPRPHRAQGQCLLQDKVSLLLSLSSSRLLPAHSTAKEGGAQRLTVSKLMEQERLEEAEEEDRGQESQKEAGQR